MKILLCGASGFIGRNLARALSAAGHQVTGTATVANKPVQPGTEGNQLADFRRDTDPATWRPRLAGFDAVVNAVGVLRDTSQKPIRAVHTDTPRALFDACAQTGIHRVVHISALGIENSLVPYATSKLAAEEHLLGLRAKGQLDGMVLRPSIVFGAGGDSSSLFMSLARLPVLMLPRIMLSARIQPVAVGDLAQAVTRLVALEAPMFDHPLACVGPTPLSIAQFVASLRAQTGHKPASVVALPRWMTTLSARIGDHIPSLPFCSDTLALMGQDNVASADAFTRLLGSAPIPPQDLVRTQWH